MGIMKRFQLRTAEICMNHQNCISSNLSVPLVNAGMFFWQLHFPKQWHQMHVHLLLETNKKRSGREEY